MLKELKSNVEELIVQFNKGEHTLDGARSALKRILKEASKWSAIKKDGIRALNEEQRSNAMQLIDSLAKVGLFVVPVGELEGWIKLGTSKKNKWIIPALDEINKQRTPEGLKKFIGDVLKFFK